MTQQRDYYKAKYEEMDAKHLAAIEEIQELNQRSSTTRRMNTTR